MIAFYSTFPHSGKMKNLCTFTIHAQVGGRQGGGKIFGRQGGEKIFSPIWGEEMDFLIQKGG